MAGQLFIRFQNVEKGSYRKLLISKHEAICGESVEFEPVDFFGLRPGEEVKSIGDGRENGCVRTDHFTVPHRYVGKINIDGEDNYAFEVPKVITSRGSGVDPEKSYFLLYQRLTEEIFCYKHVGDGFYIRWIKPVFQKV